MGHIGNVGHPDVQRTIDGALTTTILRPLQSRGMEPRSADHWEGEPHRWAAWARAPRHDAYWYYRDAFFALVPPAGRATLEVGFGEGRVSRDLVARGHRVTGVDVSPTLALARLAAEADRTHYLLADGAALPFGAGAFDLIVAVTRVVSGGVLTGLSGVLTTLVLTPFQRGQKREPWDESLPIILASCRTAMRTKAGRFENL